MVKITSSTHPGGSPTFDYQIQINGITIGLDKQTFKELTEQIGDKIAKDYEDGQKIYTEFWQKKHEQTEILNWLDEIVTESITKQILIPKETANLIFHKLTEILY